MATGPSPEQFARWRRPAGETFLDQGFRHPVIALASLVGLLLAGSLITVAAGAHHAITRFGLGALATSGWDPVGEQFGALAAIDGTLVSSLLALLIAVPPGVGTAIVLTEAIIRLRIRQVLGVMVELLAAIPSVVLGLWAAPWAKPWQSP